MANVDLTSPETLARSVIENAPAAGAARTPRQAQADRIRTEAVEKGPKSALESLGLPNMPDKATSDSFLNRHFYSEYNNTGNRIRRTGSESFRRYQEAQQRETIARTYIERGYDALNNAQRTEAVRYARESLDRWPEAKALFDAITPPAARDAQVRQTIEQMLRDPNFKIHAQRIFSEAFDSSNMPDIDPLMRAKLSRAEENRNIRRQELSDNATERNNLTTIIRGLRDTTPGQPGARLNFLRSNQDNLNRANQILQNEIAERRAQIAENNQLLSGPLARNATEVRRLTLENNNLRRDITTKGANLNAIQTNLNELQTLESRLANAEQERKKLIEDSEMLRTKASEADEAYDEARINFESSKNAHDRAEQQFNDRLRDVFREGMQKYLEKRITDAEASQQKLIDQDTKAAKDNKSTEETNMINSLNTRWDRDVSGRNAIRKWWNPNNREYAKDVINYDYQRLVQGGPDVILRDMLRAANPGRFVNNVAADAWIAANGEAVGRMRSQMVETLLTKRIQTGSVTEGDARFIAGSTWGREAITKAIDNRDDIQKTIKDLRDRGIIRGNASEWLADQLKKNPVFWMSILFGSVAVGALAPALIAGGVGGLMAAGPSALGAMGAGAGAGAGLVGGRLNYNN